MSAYFYTKDLSFKDLIDNKELLLKFVERMHSKEYATTNIKWAKFNEQKK